jgi:hypothetical protein
MAQTKTKPKKRGTGGKSTSGSKNASQSAKARSGSSSTKRKSTSSKAKSKSKSRSSGMGSSSRSKSSTTKRTGGNRGKSSQRSSGGGRSALETMKVPATVAGAAMLAVAGGLAASRNGSKSGFLPGGSRGKLGLPSPKSGLKSLKRIDLSKVDLPKPEEAIDWVEEKAKGVGDAGYRVAELTSQARSVRRAVSGDD